MYIFKHHFQGSIMIMKIMWIGWMNSDKKVYTWKLECAIFSYLFLIILICYWGKNKINNLRFVEGFSNVFYDFYVSFFSALHPLTSDRRSRPRCWTGRRSRRPRSQARTSTARSWWRGSSGCRRRCPACRRRSSRPRGWSPSCCRPSSSRSRRSAAVSWSRDPLSTNHSSPVHRPSPRVHPDWSSGSHWQLCWTPRRGRPPLPGTCIRAGDTQLWLVSFMILRCYWSPGPGIAPGHLLGEMSVAKCLELGPAVSTTGSCTWGTG